MNVEGVRSRTDGPLAGIAFVISLLYAVYMTAMGSLLPVLGETFGMGTEAQGRLFPASFGGSVTGLLLSGYLSDRLNRRNILLICLGMGILGFFCFSRAAAFPIILLAAGLVGAGNAAAHTLGGALLSDLYPERRAANLNAIQVGFGVGAILGPLLVQGALNFPNVGWRGFYFALALVQTLLLVLLITCPIPQKRNVEGPGIDFVVVRKLLRERLLLLLCLSAGTYAGVEVAFFSWLPTYLGVVPGGVAFQGIVVSAFWVAMTIGRIGLGIILGRIPLRKLQIALAISGTICSTLCLVAPSPALIVTAAVLTGLSFSGLFSLLAAEGGERYPHAIGTVLSLIAATCSVGAGFIPWLIGQLNSMGLPWAMALAVVPIGSLAVALLSLARPKLDVS